MFVAWMQRVSANVVRLERFLMVSDLLNPTVMFAFWSIHSWHKLTFHHRTVFARSRGCKIVNAQLNASQQSDFSASLEQLELWENGD